MEGEGSKRETAPSAAGRGGCCEGKGEGWSKRVATESVSRYVCSLVGSLGLSRGEQRRASEKKRTRRRIEERVAVVRTKRGGEREGVVSVVGGHLYKA